MRRLACLPLAVALLASGCRKHDAPPPAPVTPATAAQADELGKAMATALSGCDPEAVSALVDLDSLARRAALGRKVPAAARRGFVEGARGAAIGQSLCANLGEGAEVAWLRSRDRGHGPAPLLRVLSDAGVTYLELEVGTTPGADKVRAVDFVNYTTGEPASETLGRMMEAMIGSRGSDPIMADLEHVQAARRKLSADDVAGARAEYDALSPRLKADKGLRLFEIELTSEETEAAYLAALERFERDFPDDPGLLVQSIDRQFLRKDFAGVLERLDRLDRAVGGDPYLDALRANALHEQGKDDLAVAAARRATAAEPGLETAWWSLVTLLLATHDHAGVIAALDHMVATFHVRIAPADDDEVWADFVASREGAAWLAAHAEAEHAP